jgi:single-strand DNA-binding protein
MPNLSRVFLIGHLGADPELKYLPDGKPLLKLRLAVSTGFGDRKRTSWYSLSGFGERFARLSDHLFKGQAIHAEGEIEMREWTDQSQQKRLTPEVRLFDVTPLAWRDRSQQGPGEGQPAEAGEGQPGPAAGPSQGTLGDEEVPF